MHHIHTTEGLVIASKPYKEGGKMLYILTSDFGLISAIAEGVRLEKSKLRYHSQDYSFALFSLVHGREFWRVVGASAYQRQYSAGKEKVRLSILTPLSLLLRRLLHGEGDHGDIFSYLKNCADYIEDSESFNEEDLKTLESLTVIRVLRKLGYVGNDPNFEKELETDQVSREVLDRMRSNRAKMNEKINLALRESHL